MENCKNYLLCDLQNYILHQDDRKSLGEMCLEMSELDE